MSWKSPLGLTPREVPRLRDTGMTDLIQFCELVVLGHQRGGLAFKEKGRA
jgi:hypothetical protein